MATPEIRVEADIRDSLEMPTQCDVIRFNFDAGCTSGTCDPGLRVRWGRTGFTECERTDVTEACVDVGGGVWECDGTEYSNGHPCGMYSSFSSTDRSDVTMWVDVSLDECDGAPIGPGEPTPTPTMTPTATTWASPTPYATVDSDQCRMIDWRDDTGPATEFDFDVDNLLGDTDCFNVVPEMSVTTPDLGAIGDLIGLDTYTIEWDGVELCAIWVNMPVWSVVGLNISMDWFLLPAVAWFINKLLSL